MNAPVNIVYPIQGESFPKTNPDGGNRQDAYVCFNFSVTKAGGTYNVSWGVDNQTLGNATYYDAFSTNFMHKLRGGKHEFWVKGDSGSDSVRFSV